MNKDFGGRKSMIRRALLLAFLLAAALLRVAPALAEAKEVRLVGQYGLPYLPFMVMESGKLIEKHAKAAGLGDVAVSWDTVTGPSAMIDSLLAGARDIIGARVPSLATLWAKTKGTPIEVRGMSALQSMPYYLMTRNPKVQSLKDFSDADRIALPAVKITSQALILEIAASQAFGDKSYDKLDPLTVTMAHPQAAIALIGGKTEINAHFASAPFYWDEAADPAIHRVLHSYEVLGGPHTNGLLITTKRFHDGSPTLYRAVLAAQEEANAFIKERPRDAAEIYLRLANDKRNSVETMTRMVSDPEIDYTTIPLNTMKVVEFMHRVGRLPEKPASWKDLFFANAHGLPGS
jgi:NitT/TauT family transport system substrate-binding protein